MTDNHPDYLESLFQGIDIILEKRLGDVSYDTTIICTITDASDSKNGKYRVTDGSVTYVAYSDVDSYKAGEQVRVSVPMGDYSQKKFIVGKYVTDLDSAPMTYVSPLESVVNMSGNLIPVSFQTSGITANGTDRSRIIWNMDLVAAGYTDLQVSDIYNTIILKADFKTLLSNWDLYEGTYGLRLDLLVRPSAHSTGRIRRYVELSSKEMFGNPYAFSIYSTQAETFTISTIGIIEGVELSIYQNNDFKDRNIGLIPPNAFTDDIIVSNIELGFGSDILNVEDNVVKIYSKSDLRYQYDPHSNNTNLKNLSLLWYNKDDNNQYIGFSDGIYDPKYDELEYLAKSRMDTRLLAQKGREGIPTDKDSLNLAANIEEAQPLIAKARDIINQDLTRILIELRQQVIKVEPLVTAVNLLITAGDGHKYLTGYADAITKALSNPGETTCGMMQQYAGTLRYARETQTEIPEDRHIKWNSLWGTKYYEIINTNFKNVRDAIAGLFTTFEANILGTEAQYSGYKGIYDVYKIRIERIINTMNQYLGVAAPEGMVRIDYADTTSERSAYNKDFPIGVLSGADYNLLQTYRTKSEFKTYKEQDLSAYHGKYCIYWYRYEKDYKSTDIESLMPDGWRRLEPSELITIEDGVTIDTDGINVGLSGKDENNIVDGKPHHLARPAIGKGYFNYYMQNDLEQERFVALVFFNHNMFKSNELVFTNSQVIPDKTTLDKGDILIFEHLDRSSDNFQVYTETNYLMDAADEHHARQIRCHYDGLLAKDEALVSAGIYWYVPINSTMLTYDTQFLLSKGFVTDEGLSIDARPEYSKDGYTCFYKEIEAEKKYDEEKEEYYWDYVIDGYDNRDFWYKIKPYYESSASQNTIICQVKVKEDSDPVFGEQTFAFGIAGTNGTRYTLAVTNQTTKPAVTASEGLNLNVSLRNFNNETQPLYRTNTMNMEAGSAYNCQAGWYFLRQQNTNGPDVTLLPLEANATEVNGLSIPSNTYGILEVTAAFALPTVEEGDDAPETEDVNGAPTKYRTVDLDCLYPVPWAAGKYYISGPTQIIYNSYGTLDNTSMFNNPYKIFNADDHTEVKATWDIEYYIKNGDAVEQLSDVIITEESTADDRKKHNNYVFYKNYMPVINDAGGLTPATLYLDNLDCYAVVVAKNESGVTLWEQPIIILQNRYASSFLNDWDGSLTIDEENGTIMSSMIGAGRKSSNNTFEGVLMGNVALGTESNIGFENKENVGFSNQQSIGLYGFHDGAQSFGFNIDGTAFLGKAGRGRIIFNGNYGVIASANWFNGNPDWKNSGGIVGYNPATGEDGIIRTSAAGMCIDLVNGHIDAYDFKLTGSRIHFNSNPQMYDGVEGITGFYMRIGHDGETVADYAEIWLRDSENSAALKALATPGYLALDSKGNLTIRVNSLYLTGQLGGTNLLRQTSPKKNVPVPIGTDGTEAKNPIYGSGDKAVYDWGLDYWIVGDGASLTSSRTDISALNDNRTNFLQVSNSNYTISQTVKNIKPETEYTISGYVTRTASTTLDNVPKFEVIIENTTTPHHSLSTNIVEYEYGAWSYFEYTFMTNEGINELTVQFKGQANYALWHAMLELGSVATSWSAAPEDVDENVLTEQNRYDTYLAQDEIFKKLTTDPNNGQTMVGIWLLPGEESASGHKELYINATYMATGILRSSNWNGELKTENCPLRDADGNIVYDENGDAVPATDAYGNTLQTYVISKAPTKGVYFNLNEGKIWAAKFELTAGDSLYLNSHPGNNENYFRIGNTDNYIRFAKISGTSTSLSIKSNIFTLIAGDEDTGIITIDSQAETYPLSIADKFKVKWDGTLSASNANISGDITATTLNVTGTGSIGGWTITKTSIEKGNMKLTSSGDNGALTAGSASIGTDGILRATSAILTTLTVNKSLTIAKDNGAGSLSVAGNTTLTGAVTIGTTTSTTTLTVNGTNTITGTSQLDGNVTIGTSAANSTLTVGGNVTIKAGVIDTDNTSFRIYSKNRTHSLYLDTNQFGLFGDVVHIGSDTIYVGNGWNTSASQIYVNGKMLVNAPTTISGDLTYDADIYCKTDSGTLIGKTDNFTMKSLTMGKVTLSFVHGIFVGGTGGESTESDEPTVLWPATAGQSGKFLQVDSAGTGVQWTSVPCITAGNSGTVWSSYYQASSSGNVTGWYPIAQLIGASYGNNGKFLKASTTQTSYGIAWETLYAPTTTGTDGQVWTSTGTGGNWENLPAAPTLTSLLPAMNDKMGKVLKVNSSGTGVYWGDDNNTTYDLSSASVSYASSAGAVARATGAQTYVTTQGTDTSGKCYRGPTVSSLSGDSSRRFKHDINNLVNSDSLYSLQPVSYYYNDEKVLGTNLRYGFIAEDILPLVPELVEMDREDPTLCNAVYYNSILTLAVAEIQKLRKELDDLKSNFNIKN